MTESFNQFFVDNFFFVNSEQIILLFFHVQLLEKLTEIILIFFPFCIEAIQTPYLRYFFQ